MMSKSKSCNITRRILRLTRKSLITVAWIPKHGPELLRSSQWTKLNGCPKWFQNAMYGSSYRAENLEPGKMSYEEYAQDKCNIFYHFEMLKTLGLGSMIGEISL